MLGVYLELPSCELENIRQHSLSEGVERCKAAHALFNVWLKSNPKASRDLIAVRKGHLATSLPPSVSSRAEAHGCMELEKRRRYIETKKATICVIYDLKNLLEEKLVPFKKIFTDSWKDARNSGEHTQVTSFDALFR